MDDEPMWAAERVVALTLGSAITIPETANEFAIKDIGNVAVRLMMFPLSLTGEAKTWLDELNEGTIKTWDELRTAFISQFFPPAIFDRLLEEIRAFSQHENESLTDGWLRMKEMLQNCHGHNLSKGNIIKIFYHGLSEITQEVLNAAYKELQSCAKQPTPDLDEADMPMSCEEEAKFMQTFCNTRFYNDYRVRDSNRDNWRSSGRNDYNRDNYRSNTDDKSSLPSNTQPNPRGSKAYQPSQARNEHVNVVFTISGKSYNPPDNPDDQQNNSKNPINFDSDDEDDEPTPQPKTQPIKLVK
ncbi:reverse transcriptase domain-containing protein [Tanacetum coccineum]